MDLNNLSQPLREGIRIPTEDGRVKVVTPVFRISFPHLDKPYAGKDGNWVPKYSVQMLFNAKNDGLPARIDMTKNLLPAILEVAKAAGLQYQIDNLGKDDYRGRDVPFQKGENFTDKNGDRAAGYEDGVRFFNAKNKNKIPLYDSKRNPLAAEWFKAGYYARAVVGIYASNGQVCYGCEEIQLIARGEPLGGGSREYGDYMGSTDGENFDGAPPQDPAPSEGGAPSDADMWHAGGGSPAGDDIPF